MRNRLARQGLSGTALKLLALGCMFLDHIGAVVLEPLLYGDGVLLEKGGVFPLFLSALNLLLRLAGRLAFPLFCFLLVEGFVHTRSVWRYLLRLFGFALLSEPVFDWAVSGRFLNFSYQNVLFTLALGLLVLVGVKKAQGWAGIQFFCIAAGAGVALLLQCDYSAIGVLCIAAFYLLRGDLLQRDLICGLLLVLESRGLFGAAALALLPIRCYNGQRGRIRLKLMFYGFYPLHLLLLSLVRQGIFPLFAG